MFGKTAKLLEEAFKEAGSGNCPNDSVVSVPEQHCQNGRADICLAGSQDGICCAEHECDIDDGLRKAH